MLMRERQEEVRRTGPRIPPVDLTSLVGYNQSFLLRNYNEYLRRESRLLLEWEHSTRIWMGEVGPLSDYRWQTWRDCFMEALNPLPTDTVANLQSKLRFVRELHRCRSYILLKQHALTGYGRRGGCRDVDYSSLTLRLRDWFVRFGYTPLNEYELTDDAEAYEFALLENSEIEESFYNKDDNELRLLGDIRLRLKMAIDPTREHEDEEEDEQDDEEEVDDGGGGGGDEEEEQEQEQEQEQAEEEEQHPHRRHERDSPETR